MCKLFLTACGWKTESRPALEKRYGCFLPDLTEFTHKSTPNPAFHADYPIVCGKKQQSLCDDLTAKPDLAEAYKVKVDESTFKENRENIMKRKNTATSFVLLLAGLTCAHVWAGGAEEPKPPASEAPTLSSLEARQKATAEAMAAADAKRAAEIEKRKATQKAADEGEATDRARRRAGVSGAFAADVARQRADKSARQGDVAGAQAVEGAGVPSQLDTRRSASDAAMAAADAQRAAEIKKRKAAQKAADEAEATDRARRRAGVSGAFAADVARQRGLAGGN